MKDQVRWLLPRGVHPHRVWAGPLRGRRLVTSWHDYPAGILGYTERSLLEWMARSVQPGETWIDVGAHYGYTALALSDLVGTRGRVFAFEPVLTTAGQLSRTRALNQVPQLTVVPLALTAHREVQAIEVALVRGMAEHSTAVRTTLTDRVLGIAFDEIWPGMSKGETTIHGVKIDVQGMEIDVLTGMREALIASRPQLVVEVHPGVDRQVLLRLLSTLGYSQPGRPVDVLDAGDGSTYVDDRSYCFLPQ